MTNQKNQEPNPIEKAIGERAKETTPSTLRDAPDQPLTQNEMVNLEELQRQTEERLREEPEEEIPLSVHLEPMMIVTPKNPPVSKPDPQPVTGHCSQESPPQGKFEKQIATDGKLPQTQWVCPDCSVVITGPSYPKLHECYKGAVPINENTIGALDELVKQEIPDVGGVLKDDLDRGQTYPSQAFEHLGNPPVEDKHLKALRDYILDTGFSVSGVAYHIVSLCSQPMTTPTTTSWDFRDRAMIPEMVFALLRQPGYIEGIWPSLKVVMADNKGNAIWTAGIATTIAFFDVIRTLPALKEMQNETPV